MSKKKKKTDIFVKQDMGRSIHFKSRPSDEEISDKANDNSGEKD